MKNSVRRGLFHPDDIKILGLSGHPGPMSAPLPGLSKKSSRPSLSPLISSTVPSFGPASATAARRAHSRSPSFAGHASSGSGSFGRSEARRIQSQSGFDKYTEDDDEDYEDVFGKPNANGKSFRYLLQRHGITDGFVYCDSDRAADADLAIEYAVVQQVLGTIIDDVSRKI
jgi:hypothetical protein